MWYVEFDTLRLDVRIAIHNGGDRSCRFSGMHTTCRSLIASTSSYVPKQGYFEERRQIDIAKEILPIPRFHAISKNKIDENV